MKVRRGFSLIEILLALSLLGVFTLIASRVLTANFKISKDLAISDNNSARFDLAERAMHTDVFNSRSIEMRDVHTLRIQTTASQTVEWTASGNVLSRKTTTQTSAWHVGQPVFITLDGAVVLLSTSTTNQIAMAPAVLPIDGDKR